MIELEGVPLGGIQAVLVTRGDVDLAAIVERLRPHFGAPIVYDNSAEEDLGPFGQYVAAVGRARGPLVYFQDDDVIVSDPAAIAQAWKPGRIVCNMPAEFRPHYEDAPDKLLGFGSVFELDLIVPTFTRYLRRFPSRPRSVQTPLAALLLAEGASADGSSVHRWEQIERKIVHREAPRIFSGLNRARLDLVDVPKTDLEWASADNRLWKQPDHGVMRDEARRRVCMLLAEEARARA